MTFTFVTLFKNLISGYFEDSILKRAIEKEIINIAFFNPRDFSANKHKKVDDYAVGGGAGLVMSAQPLFDCLKNIKQNSKNAHFIFLSPSAKLFNQKESIRLSKKEHIVFVCGRYEGIDERVIEEFGDEVFSIGDFILTGGELPACMMCDSISRNIKGVLGNEKSLEVESFNNFLLEAPAFSKPKNFRNKLVISEYLKGNHAKIADLKLELSKQRTKFYRPDLYERYKRITDEK
jgi:tRNA (guanine37-N1)-methyltransferase